MNDQAQNKKKFSGLIWVVIFVVILGWYLRDSISTWRTSATSPAFEISAGDWGQARVFLFCPIQKIISNS